MHWVFGRRGLKRGTLPSDSFNECLYWNGLRWNRVAACRAFHSGLTPSHHDRCADCRIGSFVTRVGIGIFRSSDSQQWEDGSGHRGSRPSLPLRSKSALSRLMANSCCNGVPHGSDGLGRWCYAISMKQTNRDGSARMARSLSMGLKSKKHDTSRSRRTHEKAKRGRA